MKVRYHVMVQTSSRGIRKQDSTFTKEPVRPGSVTDVFNDIVNQQYAHIGFGLRTFPRGTTKYPVRGVRWKGAGVDGTDIVWMWCPQTKAAVVVKAVRK